MTILFLTSCTDEFKDEILGFETESDSQDITPISIQDEPFSQNINEDDLFFLSIETPSPEEEVE